MAELNVPNRTLFVGDNLEMLRGLNSEYVDLVYLDPPFNSKKNYAAPNRLGSLLHQLRQEAADQFDTNGTVAQKEE